MSSRGEQHAAPGGRAFWAASAVGGGVMLFGILGLLRNGPEIMLGSWVRFFVGGLILHDGLWAPIVGLASLALVRFLPAWIRPTVQGALIVTSALILISIPALTGRGRLPTNPSILPNDYWGNLALVLGLVWLVAGALALRARSRPPTAVDPPKPTVYPRRSGW